MLESGIIMKLINLKLLLLLFNWRFTINGQWNVVIRFDCAHGFPHLDQYYLDGRKIKEN
jgi:hypothetical protein